MRRPFRLSRGKSAKEQKKAPFLRRADLLLLFGLLLLGLFLLLLLRGEPGAYVTVRIGEETVARYPLSVNASYELNGGSNLLVICDGAAYIERADCPDGLCIGQGKISREGERIVCLPNRVMITVE